MVLITSAKYRGTDDYKNHCFIVSKKFNPESYEYVKALNGKLYRLFPDSYNPIYWNEKFEYVVIQCVRDSKFKFTESYLYDITFDVTQKTVDNKVYVNCVLSKTKFVKKVIIDRGEIVNLDIRPDAPVNV